MPTNPNWARWIHASIGYALTNVAKGMSPPLPVMVEGVDERSSAFMQASDRAEIRITGPFSQKLGPDDYLIYVDANVLITSRYDGYQKNALQHLLLGGIFQEAMDTPIVLWNYGNQAGDYVDGSPDTQVDLGCLTTRVDGNSSVKLFNFGQIDKTDKIKQVAVDARYFIYLPD